MQILGISHLGIASKDPSRTKWFFRDVLQLPFVGDELVESQKTHTTMFDTSMTASSGKSRLEILENQEGEDGPIKGFILKRGGGIHHLALQVACIKTAISKMKEMKVEMIDNEPRPGAHNTQIAFVHPRATGGVLIELVEEHT